MTTKGNEVSCFDVAIRVLVITDETAVKSRILSSFGRYLWSEDNENRYGTNLIVNYVTHSESSDVIKESPLYYNIIVVDSPPNNSFKGYAKLRKNSEVSVIICITESEDSLRTEDGASEFADLIIARPVVPSYTHWRDLVSLLVSRMESDDFLPSPLIQHYMSTL